MLFRIYIFLLAFSLLLTLIFASLYPVRDLTEAGNSIIKKKGEERTQEKLQEATTYFKEAYNREPSNIIVIYNLANAYHHQGEFSKAVHLYQEAIDLAKKKEDFELLARLYYNLGNTYYKKEDFGKAVESYILAMDEDEHDLQIKNNFELAFNKLQKNKRPLSNPRQTQKSNKKNGRDQQSQEKNSTGNYNSNKQNNPQNKNQSKDNKSNSSSDSKSSNTLSSKDNQGYSSSNPNLNKKKRRSTSEISLERAEQILNSYQNRQKRFESFRKYNQKISSSPNSKNW